MDWSEVAAVRLVALPVILLTGRPYAIWRDAALRRAPGGMIGRTLADVAAFLTFQVPVTLAILALGGADRSEMALAAGAAVLLCVRPSGSASTSAAGSCVPGADASPAFRQVRRAGNRDGAAKGRCAEGRDAIMATASRARAAHGPHPARPIMHKTGGDNRTASHTR